MQMLALKSGQLRHCSQFLSWLKVTVLWPSADRSSPRKLSYMYHTQKAPTVAKPTYAPTSIHLPESHLRHQHQTKAYFSAISFGTAQLNATCAGSSRRQLSVHTCILKVR